MPRFKFKTMQALLALSWLVSPFALAKIPAAFEPVVIEPPMSLSERRVNLTPALAKAQRENKPVLVYLGAADCPPCKAYSAFLDQHKTEMAPVMAGFVIADIRTWLRGPKLVFELQGQRMTVAEFKQHVGDPHKALLYPSWWLLKPDGAGLRALPPSSAQYLAVESHIRLLSGSMSP